MAIYKLTGLTYVYTLECSYNTGRLVNRLNPPAVPKGMDKQRVLSLSPPPPPARAASSPKYNPESWRSVGRALAVAFLDIHEANEISRLGGGLRGLRGFIGAWVRTQQKKAAEASAAGGKGRGGSGGGGGGGGGGGSGSDEEEGEEEGEPELRGEEEAGLSDEEEGEEEGAPAPCAAPKSAPGQAASATGATAPAPAAKKAPAGGSRPHSAVTLA